MEELVKMLIQNKLNMEYLRNKAVVQESTKTCYNCENENLLLLRTFNLKICTDCDTVIWWKLDKNQKQIL